jgi:integrase
MLLKLYPKVHRRYTSLPILGPLLDGFGTWLLKQIVSLTLDDVEWRARRLRVRQRKTSGVLWLPLTDEVATALLDYLREGRPQLAVRRYRRGFQTDPPQYREVFLRCRTPAGVLQSTAIAEAFQAWSRRSGLKIPFQGVHCLRHSYALQLWLPETQSVMLSDSPVNGRVQMARMTPAFE